MIASKEKDDRFFTGISNNMEQAREKQRELILKDMAKERLFKKQLQPQHYIKISIAAGLFGIGFIAWCIFS